MGKLLVKPYIKRRHNLPRTKIAKDIVKRIQNEAKLQSSLAAIGQKRSRCYLCQKTDNKSTNICRVYDCYVCKLYVGNMWKMLIIFDITKLYVIYTIFMSKSYIYFIKNLCYLVYYFV